MSSDIHELVSGKLSTVTELQSSYNLHRSIKVFLQMRPIYSVLSYAMHFFRERNLHRLHIVLKDYRYLDVLFH